MSNVWFIADQHFDHTSILKSDDTWGWREFDSVEDMNEALIEAHNAVVAPGDRVYHLGDFQFSWGKNASGRHTIQKLNGQHYLIRGNHDRVEDWGASLVDPFVWIRRRDALRIKRPQEKPVTLVLDHFPLRTWDKRHHGALHLYGHVHGQISTPWPGTLDVGVDATYKRTGEYRPVSLDEVVELTHAEAFWSERQVLDGATAQLYATLRVASGSVAPDNPKAWLDAWLRDNREALGYELTADQVFEHTQEPSLDNPS
jgi:calcineurin-like phosphoesterase family protein